MAEKTNANIGFENNFGTQPASYGDTSPQQNIGRSLLV